MIAQKAVNKAKTSSLNVTICRIAFTENVITLCMHCGKLIGRGKRSSMARDVSSLLLPVSCHFLRLIIQVV